MATVEEEIQILKELELQVGRLRNDFKPLSEAYDALEKAEATLKEENEKLAKVVAHNTSGMADAIHAAFVMNKEDRRTRMRRMRRLINKNDIFWWVDSFLGAAIAKDLSAFPLPEDYLPENFLPADDIHSTSI